MSNAPNPDAALRSVLPVSYADHLELMVRAARRASEGVREAFLHRAELEIQLKHARDLVTSADLEAESIITETLLTVTPAYALLGEEVGLIPGSDPHYRWIIDPIDGTTNFVHGLPHFCIAIALEERREDFHEIVAAVICQPISQEMFTATHGGGAFMNSLPLDLAESAMPKHLMLALGTRQSAEDLPLSLPEGSVRCARMMGSSVLDMAWLAAGRMHAVWHQGIRPWDIAAGWCLAREAGALPQDGLTLAQRLERGDVLMTAPFLPGNAAPS